MPHDDITIHETTLNSAKRREPNKKQFLWGKRQIRTSIYPVPMKYDIRPLTPADQTFLWEMLYQSLHVPAGEPPFDRNVLSDHDVAKYVEDWGRETDAGFVAVDENGRSIAAVWMRLFSSDDPGYGYVDDETPEIGMAVLPEQRGKGVGTRLISELIESAAGVHKKLSLSVAAENPARRLYERHGFEVVRRSSTALVMQRNLGA